ncbi:MAG: hypothetical protein BGN86_15350 [Caulobacterales bacterium 68-7]|nr:MAG: hypothetical protein BGN86_15350 [Caulobacterales bacterium 68-7]
MQDTTASKQPSRARRIIAAVASVAAGGAVVATIPAALGTATWMRVRELQKQWTVSGPPCPTMPAYDPRVGPLKGSFPYLDATYSYGRAQVYCADVPKSGVLASGTYQVCQFNNPGIVQVETAKGVAVFGPMRGHRATVAVRDGAASCIVGGWFAGN